MRSVWLIILATVVSLGSGCASLAWKDGHAQDSDPLKGDKVATTPPARNDEGKAKLKEPQLDDGPLRPRAETASRPGDARAAPASMPKTLASSPAALALPQSKSGGEDGYLGMEKTTKGTSRPVEQAQWTAPRPTMEQLQESLRAKGIVEYDLEQKNGTWYFRCYVSNPDNPKLKRCYEGESSDDVDAVLGVLKKLDQRR